MIFDVEINFENQILALFDGCSRPINKSHEKINVIFVINAIMHFKIYIGNYRYGIGILPTTSKTFSLYRELLKPLWVIYQ